GRARGARARARTRDLARAAAGRDATVAVTRPPSGEPLAWRWVVSPSVLVRRTAGARLAVLGRARVGVLRAPGRGAWLRLANLGIESLGVGRPRRELVDDHRARMSTLRAVWVRTLLDVRESTEEWGQ